MDANSYGVGAEMFFACMAIPTVVANNMAFSGNAVSLFKLCDTFSYSVNNSKKLVPGDKGDRNDVLGPFIPVINVEVCTTDGCLFYFDKNILLN